MKTAILHIGIAMIWLFLSPTRDLPRLLIGLLIGWLMLSAFRPLLPQDRYLKGLTAFVAWCWAFLKALLLSQIRVSAIVLFPKTHPIHPGFVEFPIGDLGDAEIILLSHSISLTPGTTTVEVDKDRRILLVHALEAGNPEETVRDIEDNLLKPMLAFTRP
jgi:multicomponent Na+:H+ antiporter subunit E